MNSIPPLGWRGRGARLRAVLLFRQLLGFHSDFQRHKLLAFISRLYCICLIINTTILGFIIFQKGEHAFYLTIILEYNLNVLVSVVVGGNHLINFYEKIQQTDLKMGLEHLPLMTTRSLLFFFVICAYDTVHLFSSLFYRGSHAVPVLISLTACAVSLERTHRCFRLELLRLRMKHLRDSLEIDLQRRDWSQNVNQTESVERSLYLYRTYVNNFKLTTSEKCLICVTMVNSSYLIVSFCCEVTLNLNNREILKGIAASLSVFMTWGITCLPAVVCETVINEVSKLKIVIGNALLKSDEGALSSALLAAADYLERRPLRPAVFRAFPLDASLVVSFSSLCVTYTIVVLQYLDIV